MRRLVRGAVVSWCRLSTRLGLFEMLPSYSERGSNIRYRWICRYRGCCYMYIRESSFVNNRSILKRNGYRAERIGLHEDSTVKFVIVVADNRGILIGWSHSALSRFLDALCLCWTSPLPSSSPFSLSTKQAEFRYTKRYENWPKLHSEDE